MGDVEKVQAVDAKVYSKPLVFTLTTPGRIYACQAVDEETRYVVAQSV